MQYEQLTKEFIKINCSEPASIFGLGREGWSTYQFLRTQLPNLNIQLIDDQPLAALDLRWQTAATQSHTTFIQSTDLQATPASLAGTVLYKTPGIPPTHPLLKKLPSTLRRSSNTQLFLDFVQFANSQLSASQQIKTIGVTGTKGKSTTSSLIAAALHESQYAPLLGGNIGKSPLDLISELDACPTGSQRAMVLELSCHQLAELTLSPHVAVIQNITPEHLDYYPTVWHYVAAKSGIVRSQQPSDTVITCNEFELPHALACLSPGSHITYQVTTQNGLQSQMNIAPELRTLLPTLPATVPHPPTPRVQCQTDLLRIDSRDFGSIDQLQHSLKLFGMHNRYNILAAVTVGVVLAVEPERILKGLLTFKPLAHRLQLIADKNGIRYINDSLATTPEAAAAAIASFAESPVILIAGGHDRHLDFAPLVDALMQHRVKGLVLFPPTGEQISAALHKRHPGSVLGETQFKVQSMPEAVQVATRLAKPGDVVLLSPASASFGTFKDYQDRGEQFAVAVGQL